LTDYGKYLEDKENKSDKYGGDLPTFYLNIPFIYLYYDADMSKERT